MPLRVSARPAALVDMNEQFILLDAMQDIWDKNEESLDHLYSCKQKLITDFNNVSASDCTDRVLGDYCSKLDLFDLHIGLQTVILEDDNNRLERQERTGINASQHNNLLASQSIQISCQQHILSSGITAQQELMNATSSIIDNFLS